VLAVVTTGQFGPPEAYELQLHAKHQQYGIPSKKVHFTQETAGRHIPIQRFALHGAWKDEAILRRARMGFDRLP
jgi:hypothetical protein